MTVQYTVVILYTLPLYRRIIGDVVLDFHVYNAMYIDDQLSYITNSNSMIWFRPKFIFYNENVNYCMSHFIQWVTKKMGHDFLDKQ